MHIVADAAATGSNRGFKGAANGWNQDSVAFTADALGSTQGRNTGAKQAFGGVDIADADDQVAVHQQRFDRRAATARLCIEPVAVKFMRKRFDSQYGQ